MTKKDFELLARALRDCRPLPLHLERMKQHDYVIRFMANALATTNPRFDRERFLNACFGL